MDPLTVKNYPQKECKAVQPLNTSTLGETVRGSIDVRNKTSFKFKSKLIHGDIIKVLRNQNPQHKFDVIIADPPYNIGNDFDNGRSNRSLPDYIEWYRVS